MRPPSFKGFLTRIRHAWLDLNAAIEFGLYDAFRGLRTSYERYENICDSLRVTGFRKFLANLFSEGLTWGTLGALVAVALAVPAFEAVQDENWLKKQDLAITFLDRYGEPIGKRGIRHDGSTKLDDVPDHLIKALLSTEDRRFYDHFGIDFIGTLRALTVNARAGGVAQGGSTLTQQLAKNLFLTNERSIERKIKEAYLAIWLESRLTKQEILKLYLDRAYMGAGNFGVQAAADFYFSKRVQDLNLSESAMLAGLFKAPTKYAPHVNLPAARARANDVLSNMVDAGYITDGQVLAARRNPATAVERQRNQDPGYFLDFAFDEVRRLADQKLLGDDSTFIVRTSFDQDLQRKTDESMEAIIREQGDERDVSQGAAVLMEPDGSVRAIYGGRDYGTSQFNRATNGLRQPGSSFKPYVYATALMTGKYKPNSVVVDGPVCIGNWCPANYGHSYSGAVPLWNALAKSINSIPVKLTKEIGNGSDKAGRVQIIDTVKRMGAAVDLRNDVTMPIGTVEMTVMGQATGYSVFANGGQRIDAHAAIEVRNSADQIVYTHDVNGPKPQQALAPQVVADMNFMLNKVVEEGTARRFGFMPEVRAAGKTGTTDSYKDAWFVGFTGNYVCAVWFGNDDNSPTKTVTGGLLPTQAWRAIMDFAHKDIDLKPIPGLAPREGDRTASGAAASGKAKTGVSTPISLGATQRKRTLPARSAAAIIEIEALFKQGARGVVSEQKPAANGFSKPVQKADGGRIAPLSGRL